MLKHLNISMWNLWNGELILCHGLLQGDILEDPANEPEKDMFVMTVDPEDAPDTPE